jgi:hypothetical protein
MARRKVNATKFREVTLEGATKMLTLEDPTAKVNTKSLAGVLVRLRPPPDTPADVVEKWRAQVAAHARAVKVLPVPRSVGVTSTRVEEPRTRVNVREVVAQVIEESTFEDKPGLSALTEAIMSAVKL